MDYRLTKSAENDIRNIIRYTSDVWGAEQSRRYAIGLHQHFQLIAERKVLNYPYFQQAPDVFRSKYQRHCVFYLMKEFPVIFAVLHERMNHPKYIKERL